MMDTDVRDQVMEFGEVCKTLSQQYKSPRSHRMVDPENCVDMGLSLMPSFEPSCH